MHKIWRALPIALTMALFPLVPVQAQTEPPTSDAPPPPVFSGWSTITPGAAYAADFPDAAIWVEGGTYYAYSTSAAGRYMPVQTSTDLTTWTARPSYLPDPYPDSVVDPFFSDALVAPAAWAKDLGFNHHHVRTATWAPGVVKLGETYLAYYGTLAAYGDPTFLARTPNRYCISVATSSSPLGPFTDTTTEPLVCDTDPGGSIDPDPFVDPVTGTPYLLWKSEGVRNQYPSRLWIRELDPSGLAFAANSQPTMLLAAEKRWEFQIIENPSMIRHADQYYLFYSAHYWQSRDYAIAVATCDGPLGPCTRQRAGEWPLLLTRGDQNGPGGADAFLGPAGELMLAYHAWNAPYTSYPGFPDCTYTSVCTTKGQRLLHTTQVTTTESGALAIGTGIDLTVGYSQQDYNLLATVAAANAMTIEQLQTFGVYALVFLTKLGGNDQRHEVVRPRPSTVGPLLVTSSFSAEDRVILDWIANHFVLTDAETLKGGAALQIFLHGLAKKR